MKKKLFIVFTVCVAQVSFGQTQRMILAEEFTNAGCGPCAASNPTYVKMLKPNQDKVISLQYHPDWPGSDPFNAQNPTDVATRVSYYNQVGVPTAYFDGNTNLHPLQITQYAIDAEHLVTSPFSITLNTYLNNNKDSIFIAMNIICSQAVTGNFVAQMAIVENMVKFNVAPGINGEKEYQYNIMRKMLPNANGTVLNNSWTVGQAQTITFAEKIPTYIYDKNQVGVVAFIQDNVDKNVKQAAYQSSLNSDISLINVGTNSLCASSLSPTVKFINKGKLALTSAVIVPTVDGIATSPVNWVGNLLPLKTTLFTLPTVNSITGFHSYSIKVTLPNGISDVATQEDADSSTYNIAPPTVTYPYVQNFSAINFPYVNWKIEDVDSDNVSWVRNSNNGGAAKLSFFNSLAGRVDNLYLQSFDLSTLGVNDNINFDFKVAAAPYGNTTVQNDRLKVEVSTDCDSTWTEVWNKAGSALYTTLGVAGQYIPSVTDYRDESINFNNFKGNDRVSVRFSGISDYGNDVYIDNINLNVPTITTLANNTTPPTVSVYPNPVNDILHLEINTPIVDNINVAIYNMIGTKVYDQSTKNNTIVHNTVLIDTQNFTNGIYNLLVTTHKSLVSKKIIVIN